MSRYQPPFTITPAILRLVEEIGENLGHWSMAARDLSPRLRRSNRIRTIQASLAIENNTFSVAQVTAVLAGKRVLGLPREIQEVRNAFAAYEQLNQWQPSSVDDLPTAGLLDARASSEPARWAFIAATPSCTWHPRPSGCLA